MRGQLTAQTVLAAVTVLVIGTVVAITAVTYDAADYREHRTASAAWCDAENGSLYTGGGMGDHAGLHCSVASGPTYHMDEIAALDYTHNHTAIRTHGCSMHRNTPSVIGCRAPLVPTLIGAGVVIVAVLVAGAWGQRSRRR